MTAMNATDPATAQRFEFLHALKVKGLAPDSYVSAMTGLDDDARVALTAELADAGLVLRRENPRMSGTMLTADGKAEYDRLAAELVLEPSAAEQIVSVYEVFLPINSDFKRVCAAWQTKTDDTPNDHTDADYDAGVITDLGAIHDRIVAALSPAGDAVARLGRYTPRLADALAKVRSGDNAAFARPMYDSYHDIWMELHQDLLLTTNRERDAADEE